MPASIPRELVIPLRAHGPVLLAAAEDPHAELLALVWGPRFDRQHAQGLLARQPGVAPQLLQTLARAADRFDGLGQAEQQRVRRLILRHRGGWDNIACTASC